jgi:hypothetical protein
VGVWTGFTWLRTGANSGWALVNMVTNPWVPQNAQDYNLKRMYPVVLAYINSFYFPSKHNTPGSRSCHQCVTDFDVNSYMYMFRSVKIIIRLTHIYTCSQATELQRYMYIIVVSHANNTFNFRSVNTLQTVHEDPHVHISSMEDRSRGSLSLAHLSFPHTLHCSHMSRRWIYCATVLSDIYSSVEYHDLALNHVSV